MSNLIERLREVQGNVTKSYRNPEGPEAADEIERLQKRVSDADECIKEQEEMLEHLIVDQSQREKEIERLRAALKDNLKHVLLADAENERLQSRLRDRQNALDHAIDYGNRADEKIERLQDIISEGLPC
jgi:peptidoglycan hydrolase CwlO-like protein